jgi:imidazolonepropionase-like amidohydrolase
MDDETARMFVDKNVWLSTQPFMSAADTGTLTGPSAERAEQLFAATPKMYELIRKHGVKTAWGSDILFSPQLAPRQSFMLTHLSQWYSNAEALRMATSGNAELLTLSNLRNPYPGKLGVIEKDALADILVLNTNPLEDIHALEKPAETMAVIMKDGRIHKNTL